MRNFKKLSLVKLSVACMVCATMFSCSGKPATSYRIEGRLQGIPDSAKIELVPGLTHKKEKPVAEAIVSDNKFTLTGTADEPRMFYLRVADTYGLVKIMVENGKIVLAGEVKRSERDGTTTYDFDEIEIKGSKLHDLYLQKIVPRNGLDSMYKAYHENNKEISDAIRAARMNKDKALLDSLYKTDAHKKLIEGERNFFSTVEKITKGIIMDNKDSWWGPLLMLDMMSYFTKEQQPWYEEFSQEAKDSYYGKVVKEELFPEGFLGKPAPAITLIGKDNKNTDIAVITSGKKYTLIDFWASWCAPCRKEIPNLKKLYGKYASKGFEIISISTDKKKADWEKALEEEKLLWPNYLDTNDASEAFKVKTIPAIFLIDDKGIIIAENIRGEELGAKLAELFN